MFRTESKWEWLLSVARVLVGRVWTGGKEGRIRWTNCGCFSQTLAAHVLRFLRSEGIFKFMSVNSTCSCPTTMLALTSPSTSSKRKSVDGWTDRWMDMWKDMGRSALAAKASKRGLLHNVALAYIGRSMFPSLRVNSQTRRLSKTSLLQSMANVMKCQ